MTGPLLGIGYAHPSDSAKILLQPLYPVRGVYQTK